LLATAAADGTIRLWPVGEESLLSPASTPAAELLGHATGVNDLAWSPSGRYLASAGDDATVRVWEVVAMASGVNGGKKDANTTTPKITARCAAVLRGHTHHVFCVAFHPAGHMLASGSFDESVRVWALRSARCLKVLPAHADPVTGLRFSSDGTLVATCSYDGLARLWHPATGKCLRTFAAGDRGAASAAPPAAGAALSPNGRFLLLATLDSALRLVDAETGRVAKTYRGHVARDYCCAGLGFLELRGQGGKGGGTGKAAGEAAAVLAGSEDGGWAMWGANSRRLMQRVVGKVFSEVKEEGGQKGEAMAVDGGGGGKDDGGREREGHRGPVFCLDWRRGGLGRRGEDGEGSVALCTAGSDGDVRFWVGEV
jgi:COMPASS component SWD3